MFVYACAGTACASVVHRTSTDAWNGSSSNSDSNNNSNSSSTSSNSDHAVAVDSYGPIGDILFLEEIQKQMISYL